MDILSLIENNIITIVGISIPTIIAIILYLKSRKVKKPIYFLRTFDIAKRDKKIPKLKLIYEGHPVETLSITRIAVLNNGNETIDSRDVAKNDPLRIEISKNFKILDADFHYIRNQANDFSLETIEKQNIIKINFDYIDEGDGGIIQVIHDGAKSGDVSVGGSVKGAGGIVQRDDKEGAKEYILFFIPLAIAAFTGMITAALISVTLEFYMNYILSDFWDLVLILISLLIWLYILSILSNFLKRKFFKNHIEFYESKM